MYKSAFGPFCFENTQEKPKQLGEDQPLWQWKSLYWELSNIAQKIVMIPNLTSMIILLIVTTPLLIFITFLPAFLELKKPRDGGPRMIMENVPEVKTYTTRSIQMEDIEEEQKFDVSLLQTIAKIIEVLPNLDV